VEIEAQQFAPDAVYFEIWIRVNRHFNLLQGDFTTRPFKEV
jgi:hypothetical protein